MAIQGNAYVKTTWAFEERPVASSKLNLWDDRIEAAVELLHFLMLQSFGGGGGIVRGVGDGDLQVQQTSPAGMTVRVQPGYAFIDGFPFRLSAATDTIPVTAPAADPRIDLVQARLDTWDVGIKTGAEAPSPDAPNADSGALALAELFLRPGMTSIKSTDDTSNGFITDVRAFL